MIVIIFMYKFIFFSVYFISISCLSETFATCVTAQCQDVCVCVCVCVYQLVCSLRCRELWLSKVDVNETLRGLAVVAPASSKLHPSR